MALSKNEKIAIGAGAGLAVLGGLVWYFSSPSAGGGDKSQTVTVNTNPVVTPPSNGILGQQGTVQGAGSTVQSGASGSSGGSGGAVQGASGTTNAAG